MRPPCRQNKEPHLKDDIKNKVYLPVRCTLFVIHYIELTLLKTFTFKFLPFLFAFLKKKHYFCNVNYARCVNYN